MMSLKEKFLHLCTPFTKAPYLIDTLWSEIEKKHSEKGRHYHNLQHLDHMFSELDSVKSRLENYTGVSFSVFYHDVVYDAASKSNEEKSVEMAESRLQELDIDQNLITKISRQIITTKSHRESDDSDTNYLLDADLSILGQDAETYREYTQKIRKEYSLYPDLLYKPGRKKVLRHFLELNSIFKTEDFREKYEKRARENIPFEIESL
jgi:predicted metal-dependent HD superfamily phosphohydrolase